MDIAKCTTNGQHYFAVDFSRLPLDELVCKRRMLKCPECGSTAFFRNATFNGSRIACFGARPHSADCGLGTQDLARYDEIHNAVCKIVVDFNYGATEQPLYVADTERTRRSVEGGCRNNVSSHRRLSSLLRILIEFPEFQNSDQPLQINAHVETTANAFFVPLLSVADHYKGHFRGYWGLISNAQFTADKSLWLNSGGRENLSFCLDSKIVDAIAKRYRINGLEDLAGAYILVIGTPQISQNRKLHIIIEVPEYMALRLA